MRRRREGREVVTRTTMREEDVVFPAAGPLAPSLGDF